MSSRAGGVDLWSQIIATESNDEIQEETGIVYRRKTPKQDEILAAATTKRVSLAPGKRVSWNRSLFTRGRTSIAVGPQKEKRITKNRPPLPRPPKDKKVHAPIGLVSIYACYVPFVQGLMQNRNEPWVSPETSSLFLRVEAKGVPPQNYEKERAYFQEVDAFELLEESPSPQSKTWVMGTKNCAAVPSHISTVLRKWLHNRTSLSLSKILETPELSRDNVVLDFSSTSTSTTNTIEETESEDLGFAIRNLSLSSNWDPLLDLLKVCGQSSPSTFSDVISEYCDIQSIAKVGEGTYGEVFIAGEIVCKVVPFDGDSLVNGEIQKKAEELLEEVMLSLTLNELRGNDTYIHNVCPTFIQTLSLRVCDGLYDDAMIRAWEEWDKKHFSENDHPTEFAEKQRFVVFVQEHGGQDLESFVLLNFNEACSLLVQVTVALAVAETAFEFEHRDLHWGNILLTRKGSQRLQYILDGKKMDVKTYGVVASIIDFTLSRINTGESILFLDLSLDPGLFEGPKGDIQSETYRKMKQVTEDCWEGSFPKTNVLWLQYLVDILLQKKDYDRTSRDERELRSFKKRLNGYKSATESIVDPFFSDLIAVSDV